MGDENKFRGFVFGVTLATTGFFGGTITSDLAWPVKSYPSVEDVEKGYVIPSKLEIKVEDLRKDGTKQTIAVYDGKSYLFKLDESGRPRIQEYEIKPVEVKAKTLEKKAEKE